MLRFKLATQEKNMWTKIYQEGRVNKTDKTSQQEGKEQRNVTVGYDTRGKKTKYQSVTFVMFM